MPGALGQEIPDRWDKSPREAADIYKVQMRGNEERAMEELTADLADMRVRLGVLVSLQPIRVDVNTRRSRVVHANLLVLEIHLDQAYTAAGHAANHWREWDEEAPESG